MARRVTAFSESPKKGKTMTESKLKSCLDRAGYVLRKRKGRYAVVYQENGGATHAHDALGDPYCLTLDEAIEEAARLGVT